MSLDFQGRVAIVTGAGGGLGRQHALALAARGARVLVNDLGGAVDGSGGTVSAARAVVDEIVAAGGQALANGASVTDFAAVQAMVAQAVDAWGRVDILVNNAGISPKQDGRSLKAEDTPLAEWAAVINVNLTAPFLLSKAALPHMKAAGWGRIINMASLAGRTRSIVSGAHYSASKAGLIGFSRMFAGEVAPYGITVNCIAPGAIDAGLGAQLNTALTENYSARIPVGRIGKPDEVAAVVAFLASSDTGFITGATFDINGGFYMS